MKILKGEIFNPFLNKTLLQKYSIFLIRFGRFHKIWLFRAKTDLCGEISNIKSILQTKLIHFGTLGILVTLILSVIFLKGVLFRRNFFREFYHLLDTDFATLILIQFVENSILCKLNYFYHADKIQNLKVNFGLKNVPKSTNFCGSTFAK